MRPVGLAPWPCLPLELYALSSHFGAWIMCGLGMHFINSAGFEWAREQKVTDEFIIMKPLWIIRVPPGSLGLATSSKKPVILGSGLHYINDAALEPMGSRSVTTEAHISNGPISIVRVEPGQIGLATINKKPLILDSGLHFINEATFEYLDTRSINDELIDLGPVKVRPSPCPVTLANAYVHSSITIAFFSRARSISVCTARVPPVQIVRVGPGMLGLGTMNARPLLLDVGVHFIDEASFQMADPPFKRVDETVIARAALPTLSTSPMGVVLTPVGAFDVPCVAGHHAWACEHHHRAARQDRAGAGQWRGPFPPRGPCVRTPTTLTTHITSLRSLRIEPSLRRSLHQSSALLHPRRQNSSRTHRGVRRGRHSPSHHRPAWQARPCIRAGVLSRSPPSMAFHGLPWPPHSPSITFAVVLPSAAFEQGEPVLYEPGSVHLVNSPMFKYVGSVDVTQQVVEVSTAGTHRRKSRTAGGHPTLTPHSILTGVWWRWSCTWLAARLAQDCHRQGRPGGHHIQQRRARAPRNWPPLHSGRQPHPRGLRQHEPADAPHR